MILSLTKPMRGLNLSTRATATELLQVIQTETCLLRHSDDLAVVTVLTAAPTVLIITMPNTRSCNLPGPHMFA
jgi:hypothetical protein